MKRWRNEKREKVRRKHNLKTTSALILTLFTSTQAVSITRSITTKVRGSVEKTEIKNYQSRVRFWITYSTDRNATQHYIRYRSDMSSTDVTYIVWPMRSIANIQMDGIPRDKTMEVQESDSEAPHMYRSTWINHATYIDRRGLLTPCIMISVAHGKCNRSVSYIIYISPLNHIFNWDHNSQERYHFQYSYKYKSDIHHTKYINYDNLYICLVQSSCSILSRAHLFRNTEGTLYTFSHASSALQNQYNALSHTQTLHQV